MKNLRGKFEAFCYRNSSKGIPNLMLYITIGSAIVYLLSLFDQSYTLYFALCFDRTAILQGQIWRLFTYIFTFDAGNPLITVIALFCYYTLGRAMEMVWGTCRFNIFYLSGVVLMDVFCMIFGGYADVYYLNLSLFLGYATLFPETRFLLLYIIPVKAWIFALIDLGFTAFSVISMTLAGLFPYSLFPLVALANYFLFFGKDVLNLIPVSWQANARRLFRGKKGKKGGPRVIPFPSAGSYEASTASVKAPYTHKCTVCGRTDVSNPELEFRYCSRCNGYHCYCEDHINNHTHVE